ncbi:hypothetical protein [Pimelobacter sp. 30-1]|uniref:hypothetical protein n=1 Tax=Pimelobacter sp. 30-1 TaxID=2004991 RepID=UPI001C048212|nr:hypothetical protein [Pimelobacter sp. 30-1]
MSDSLPSVVWSCRRFAGRRSERPGGHGTKRFAMSVGGAELDARWHSRSGSTDEAKAGEEYLALEREAGRPVSRDEVRVASVGDPSGVTMVVVAPRRGTVVREVSATSDPVSSGIALGVRMGVEERGASPTSGRAAARPSWPSWSSSFHSSVRIKVYVNVRKPIGRKYVGDAVFQTYRRKLANDKSDQVDYWQISRHAIARPANTKLLSTRVKKLWASQQLTPKAQRKAREWMWKQTKPTRGFSDCRDGVSISVGPFSISPRDCSELDVWTGDVGHQRMSMDQGAVVSGNGERSLAYVSGFSMAQGQAPTATWYEFVTFKVGNEVIPNTTHKCASSALGPRNATATETCTSSQ